MSDATLLVVMSRFQQYEIWQMNEGHWDLVSSFLDFDVAYSVTKNRSHNVRLLKVTYDQASVEQEIIAEVGSTRTDP